MFKNTFLWIGVAALGTYLIIKARKVQDFVKQANVQVVDLNMRFPNYYTTMINVVIKITNPTTQPVNLKTFYGDVVLLGKSLGTINYLNPISIPAAGSVNLNIPVSVSNLSLLGNITDMAKALAGGMELLVKGNANFAHGSVPVEQVIIAKAVRNA